MLAVQLDVSDRSIVERTAKEVETTLGRLDVLVNNAEYLEKELRIVESDPDEW